MAQEPTSRDEAQLLRPFEGFEQACERHAAQCALQIGTQRWSYADLQAWTLRVAALLAVDLPARPLGRDPSLARQAPRVGVLASRSLVAYGGSLAVLAAGAALVALNPSHPVERLARIIHRAGIEVLLVGEEALTTLQQLMPHVPGVRSVVAPLSAVEPPASWGAAGEISGAANAAALPTLRDARHMAPAMSNWPISSSPAAAPASPRVWPSRTTT
jgi:acyl-CoA synthetase (AMP-forming)/AMP-acid ligase II